ncbi:unnamed protein product [Closterium sp. NIES-54]
MAGDNPSDPALQSAEGATESTSAATGLMEAVARGSSSTTYSSLTPFMPKLHLPKFNDFPTWATQFELTASLLDLWPYYTREAAKPTSDASEAEKRLYERRNKESFLYLLNGIHEQQLKSLLSCCNKANIAEEAWSRLKTMHHSKSESSQAEMWSRFMNLKMEEDESAQAYL